MSNKQVLVYGVLESTNNLRSDFVGHIHFKKLIKFRKIYWNIPLLHDQTQEHEFGCFYRMSVHKNYFKKEKYGTKSV